MKWLLKSQRTQPRFVALNLVLCLFIIVDMQFLHCYWNKSKDLYFLPFSSNVWLCWTQVAFCSWRQTTNFRGSLTSRPRDTGGAVCGRVSVWAAEYFFVRVRLYTSRTPLQCVSYPTSLIITLIHSKSISKMAWIVTMWIPRPLFPKTPKTRSSKKILTFEFHLKHDGPWFVNYRPTGSQSLLVYVHLLIVLVYIFSWLVYFAQ